MSPPEYIFRNGLRLVKPYYATHRTTVKGRWFGKTVLQVFTQEFRDYGQSHYIERIQEGKIRVLRRKRGEDVEIKGSTLMKMPLESGDLIFHTEHIHEKPVRSSEIPIVYNSDKLLVVNKPSGIPMHPVQGFFYNSLVEILKQQLGIEQLHPCNRLDKLTSGIVMLCKDFDTASYYQQQIQKHKFEKVYIARVIGHFPTNPLTCKDDVLIVDAKHKTNAIKRRVAETTFKLIKYNPEINQSVVKCYPKTGRTHQIRIHLRNLGHPIVNDPLYNPSLNEVLGKKLDLKADGFQKIVKYQSQRRKALRTGNTCPECGIDLYKEPDPDSLMIYLHALKYSTTDAEGILHVYETEVPDWATCI